MTKNLIARIVTGLMIAATLQLCGLAQAQAVRRTGANGGVTVSGARPQANIRDHRRNGGGGVFKPPVINPPGGAGGVGGGSQNGYAGPFSGASRIEVAEGNGVTGRTTHWRNVGDLNLQGTMETAWLVVRGMIKNELTFFFEKPPRDHRNRETMESLAGRNLYDLSITMADSLNASTNLVVDAAGRSMTLRYRVPGNKMRFKAEVDNFFDPTISIETTVTIGITLQPSGNPQKPLKVANAFVEFSDTRASVDGNIIVDAVKKFVEFVKGTDFERKIEQMVNGRRQDITAEADKGMVLLNNKLSPFTTQGSSAVSFMYDRVRSQLVVRMARPIPVLIMDR